MNDINSNFHDELRFVGREQELDELLQFLATAIEGQSKFILVSGELGSGKTRLVTHFLNSLSEKLQITLLTGGCQKEVRSPYFPFLEAFTKYLSTIDNKNSDVESKNYISELINWFNGPKHAVSANVVEYSSDSWKNQTYKAFKETLAFICETKPAILFLEDIHWADSASLELLNYIVRSMLKERLLVLATFDYKNFEEAKKGKHNPLEFLKLMKRSSVFKEMKLSGLNVSEVMSLVKHVAGENVQPFIAQELHKASHGSPLFIVEYLRIILEKQYRGIDQVTLPVLLEKTAMPAKIEEIVRLRAENLTVEQRKILEIAAVIGIKFESVEIALLSSKSNIEILDGLETICQVSSLIFREGDHYKFDHSKSRQIFYDAIPAEEKKEYHSKLAEHRERSIDKYSNSQIDDLAYHYSQSSNVEKAITYSLSAGEQALSFMMDEEAVEHFTYVVDNFGDDPQYVAQIEKAKEGLGDSLFLSGNLQAIGLFEQLSNQTKSPLVKVRGLRKAARASLLYGNCAHAFAIIRNPISLSDVDRLESTRFLFTKGMAESCGGHKLAALKDLENSLNIFEELCALPDMIDALIELSIVHMQSQQDNLNTRQPDEALSCILRALALCEQIKDVNKQFHSLLWAYVIYNECALTDQAAALVDELSKVIKKIEDPKSRDKDESWYQWISSYMAESRLMEKIFSKIYDKMEFTQTPTIELTDEIKQEFQNAAEQNEKGTLTAEEGHFTEIQELLYGNLIREYYFLGDKEKLNFYFEKLENTLKMNFTPRFVFERSLCLFSKALFFSFNRQWEEANHFYQESIDQYSKLRPGTGIEAKIRQWYCCALLQQGKFEEAMRQLAQSQKIINDLDKQLYHAKIRAFILAPSKVPADKEFTFRITFTNTGKKSAFLSRMKNLVPNVIKIIASTPLLNLKNNIAEMDDQQIDALKYRIFTITAKAARIGNYTVNPEIIYKDDIGQSQTGFVEQVNITVQSAPSIQATQSFANITQIAAAEKHVSTTKQVNRSKPFDVFLCYRKSSGKDFADQLKSFLEEWGLHTFQDSRDIPLIVEGQKSWAGIRDKALEESKYFVLIMTPGFHLSSEVVKEIGMARRQTDKIFVFFRHRNMGRKIVVDLGYEILDIGKLEQVSFESKEELLRHAHKILLNSK